VTLVLGGARSGKSAMAERLAGSGPVTYVATWAPGADDADMAARVALHRARRPSTWTTVETDDPAATIVRAASGPVLVDCLTTWVAGAAGYEVDVATLCRALADHDGDVVLVSDEVGLGVHPSTEAGRRFRDALGLVNQAVAAVADDVVLVVAGHALGLDHPSHSRAPRVVKRADVSEITTLGAHKLRFGEGAAQALAFLTPFGGAAAPSPSALPWFPVVGAGTGLALGGIWWSAAQIWVPAVAAAIVVAADLVVTGMLHFDGLVDAADGLLPPLDRARRLEVMADPAAGAFGVGAAVVMVLLRWAALAALAPSAPLLSALWCASRLAMAGFTGAVPYARASGLATSFRQAGRRRASVVGIVLGAVLVALTGGDAVVGVVALALAAAAVMTLAVRRIGGFTGDVLGAATIVGETVGLLAAAARW